MSTFDCALDYVTRLSVEKKAVCAVIDFVYKVQ